MLSIALTLVLFEKDFLLFLPQISVFQRSGEMSPSCPEGFGESRSGDIYGHGASWSSWPAVPPLGDCFLAGLFIAFAGSEGHWPVLCLLTCERELVPHYLIGMFHFPSTCLPALL